MKVNIDKQEQGRFEDVRPEGFAERLLAGAKAMGVALDEEAAGRMAVYAAELDRWNRRVNLVSRRKADWVKVHFLDSLAPIALGLVRGDEAVVDLGAGAGFPGLALAIARPGLSVVLVESSGKKCAFLRNVVRATQLDRAEVAEGRFEDVLEGGFSGAFDLAVSRAAAKPERILQASSPFLRPGGRTLIYTTSSLVKAGFGQVHRYRVPGSDVPSVIWEV